jgi:DNA invertase Pin-like site-specific DNA recombinase
MAYSQKVIDAVMAAKKTPGNQLGRWAIYLDFPVTKIAYALGVTRQTVYNWFEGPQRTHNKHGEEYARNTT